MRKIAERSNDIVHWSSFDRGGHVSALEVPDLLAGDLRQFTPEVTGQAHTLGQPGAELPPATRTS